jgi:hypothetical protein
MGWQDAPLVNVATPSNSWETAPAINEALPVNPYESTFREALQNVPEGKRIMGSALAGLGGETVKNVGALTELVSPKYGKPITQFGQAMTNVASEANPVMGTIGQIGSYFSPVNALNKGAELISASKTLPALIAKNAGVGGALGFLTTPDSLIERGKSALLNAGVSGGLTAAGSKIASLLRGPEQTPQMANAVEKARDVGYVIPPTQANESLLNRLLEGTAGKITTQQNASAKNQQVTHDLVSKALGLPKDEVIVPDTLNSLRSIASKAYENIENIGIIKPSKQYTEGLNQLASKPLKAMQGFPNAKPSPIIELTDSLKSDAFDGSAALAKIIDLRDAANTAYGSNQKLLGNANKKAAELLENEIEYHLQKTGQKEMLDEFRNARQLIAKTYTVEKALNPTSGTVDARVLARELKKGKPLTEELKTVAQFAGQFPKAAQTTEMMGSRPQINPLDVGTAGILASLTNPAALASIAARPTARSLALSPFVQNRLIQTPNEPNQLAKMLMLQQTTQGTQP